MDYGDKPAAAKRSLLTPPRWSLFAPPLTASVPKPAFNAESRAIMIDGDGVGSIRLQLHRVGTSRLGSLHQGEGPVDIAVMVARQFGNDVREMLRPDGSVGDGNRSTSGDVLTSRSVRFRRAVRAGLGPAGGYYDLAPRRPHVEQQIYHAETREIRRALFVDWVNKLLPTMPDTSFRHRLLVDICPSARIGDVAIGPQGAAHGNKHVRFPPIELVAPAIDDTGLDVKPLESLLSG